MHVPLWIGGNRSLPTCPAVIIPSDDPFYREKRARLAENELSTQHTFQLSAATPLPPQLLPFLRLTFASTADEMWKVQFAPGTAAPISVANENRVLAQLTTHLKRRMAGYKTTVTEDEAIIADPTVRPRQTVAAKLVRIEKLILQGAMQELMQQPGAQQAAATAATEADAAGVRFI